MAKMRKDGFPPIGGSSLLVIFSVLCLTVFALLTISTVEAGGRLSQKAVSSVEDYYLADARAEEMLAELRAGKIVEGVACTDGVYSYEVPMQGGQRIQVKVRLTGTEASILQWQTTPQPDWVPDETLPVWDGNLE